MVRVLTADDRDPGHDGICQLPCALAHPHSLLLTSTGGFSFMGYVCNAVQCKLRCCFPVSDSQFGGFQSIIKSMCFLLLSLNFLG